VIVNEVEVSKLSLTEAENLRDLILGEIQDIQAQLSERKFERGHDVDDWRTRAKWALTIKQRQYRELKLHVHRLSQSEDEVKRKQRQLLRRSAVTLWNINQDGLDQSDGQPLLPEEQALLTELLEFFENDDTFQQMLSEAKAARLS
jgi:hypothetical protein